MINNFILYIKLFVVLAFFQSASLVLATAIPPDPGTNPNNPDQPPPRPDASVGDPIDTATGKNYFTEKRLFVPCPSIPLELNLKYQSVGAAPPAQMLGESWQHTYEWYLDMRNSRSVLLYTGSGNKFIFELNGSSYDSPASNNWKLEEDGTHPWVRLPGGVEYHFQMEDDLGLLDYIQDAWGTRVDCLYDTNDLSAPV